MLPYGVGMDTQSEPAPNNFDEVRGKPSLLMETSLGTFQCLLLSCQWFTMKE